MVKRMRPRGKTHVGKMKRLLSMLAVVALFSPAFVIAQQKTSTEAVVHAANDFLATLSAEQKQKVFYAFDDATQRARWSNFPTGFVARGGISLKQMTVPQQQAAMKLMSTLLSPMGLEKVNEIRQADDDFKVNGSRRGPGGRWTRVLRGHHRGGRADLRRSSPGAVLVGRAVPEVVHRAAICSVLICTTSRSLECLPQPNRGCCSSEGTISP